MLVAQQCISWAGMYWINNNLLYTLFNTCQLQWLANHPDNVYSSIHMWLLDRMVSKVPGPHWALANPQSFIAVNMCCLLARNCCEPVLASASHSVDPWYCFLTLLTTRISLKSYMTLNLYNLTGLNMLLGFSKLMLLFYHCSSFCIGMTSQAL